MGLGFCSLSSGSSGNCYIVKNEDTALLVDAGISGKRIFEGIRAVGISDASLKGLLITHEHTDHIKSVRVVSRKMPFLNIYASEGTWDCARECVAIENQRTVRAGKSFDIGSINVRPFALSHDAAEPVGYSFSSGESRLSIVTDTGIVTEEIHKEIKDSDILVIEANHDINTLQMCRYPYSVKRRILGDQGHLSNEAAAEEICRIISENGYRKRQIILAHLSGENNFPEMAYQTVKNVLEEHGIYIGGDTSVDIIERDKISPIFSTAI